MATEAPSWRLMPVARAARCRAAGRRGGRLAPGRPRRHHRPHRGPHMVAPRCIRSHDADALAADENTVTARVPTGAAKLCPYTLAVQCILNVADYGSVRRVRWRRLTHLCFSIAAGSLGSGAAVCLCRSHASGLNHVQALSSGPEYFAGFNRAITWAAAYGALHFLKVLAGIHRVNKGAPLVFAFVPRGPNWRFNRSPNSRPALVVRGSFVVTHHSPRAVVARLT